MFKKDEKIPLLKQNEAEQKNLEKRAHELEQLMAAEKKILDGLKKDYKIIADFYQHAVNQFDIDKISKTNAQDILVRDTPQWNQFYEETVQSYRDYFYQQYNENRIPITIGNHFSLWNDGLYWDALKQFAYEVCGKSYVKCVTFEEVISDLNNNPL